MTKFIKDVETTFKTKKEMALFKSFIREFCKKSKEEDIKFAKAQAELRRNCKLILSPKDYNNYMEVNKL